MSGGERIDETLGAQADGLVAVPIGADRALVAPVLPRRIDGGNPNDASLAEAACNYAAAFMFGAASVVAAVRRYLLD